MNREIFLLGIGLGTPIFIELAEACGYSIAGLYHYNDTRTGEIDHGYKILGSFDDLLAQDLHGKNFCLTMGDMNIKNSVSQQIISNGGGVPTLIHPTTIISRFAKISNSGVLIGNNCEIQNDVIIDEGCVLRSQILVGHNTHIGPYTFVGPKTLIGAYIEVEQRAFIGQGSLLVSGKATHIGAQSLIGAGSVVTKPVPDKAIVVGNPAKILKYKP